MIRKEEISFIINGYVVSSSVCILFPSLPLSSPVLQSSACRFSIPEDFKEIMYNTEVKLIWKLEVNCVRDEL